MHLFFCFPFSIEPAFYVMRCRETVVGIYTVAKVQRIYQPKFFSSANGVHEYVVS